MEGKTVEIFDGDPIGRTQEGCFPIKIGLVIHTELNEQASLSGFPQNKPTDLLVAMPLEAGIQKDAGCQCLFWIPIRDLPANRGTAEDLFDRSRAAGKPDGTHVTDPMRGKRLW